MLTWAVSKLLAQLPQKTCEHFNFTVQSLFWVFEQCPWNRRVLFESFDFPSPVAEKNVALFYAKIEFYFYRSSEAVNNVQLESLDAAESAVDVDSFAFLREAGIQFCIADLDDAAFLVAANGKLDSLVCLAIVLRMRVLFLFAKIIFANYFWN